MDWELSEIGEKLEKIEVEALEDTNEISPLESTNEVIDGVENFIEIEEAVELSRCPCSGGCGSNFSMSGSCSCTGSCGSNYRK